MNTLNIVETTGENVATETRAYLGEIQARLVAESAVVAAPTVKMAAADVKAMKTSFSDIASRYTASADARFAEYKRHADDHKVGSDGWERYSMYAVQEMYECLAHATYRCTGYEYSAMASWEDLAIAIEAAAGVAKRHLHESKGRLDEVSSVMLKAGMQRTLAWKAEAIIRYPSIGQTLIEYSDKHILGVLYFEADEPMFIGYENQAAKVGFRVTRRRLGTVLALAGETDGAVRERVEFYKRQRTAGVTLLAVPNDRMWSGYYTNHIDCGSCMAHELSEFNNLDTHPIDTYCAQAFGKGDNGLALIVLQDAEGRTIGRGILNTERGSMVRWYGNVLGERACKSIGWSIDREALEGSWLALVEDDGRLVHPYVDGDNEYGDINYGEGRVYLSGSGDLQLQDTDGYSYREGNSEAYCPFTDAYYREAQTTWLDRQGVACYTPVVDDPECYNVEVCYVYGEPAEDATEVQLVNGETVYICGHAHHRIFRCGATINGFRSKHGRYPDREVLV